MSDRKSKTCVIFYFHHLDTDSEQNEDHDGGKMDVHIVAEQRNTNVLVHLDFDEGQNESWSAEKDEKTNKRRRPAWRLSTRLLTKLTHLITTRKIASHVFIHVKGPLHTPYEDSFPVDFRSNKRT